MGVLHGCGYSASHLAFWLISRPPFLAVAGFADCLGAC